MNLDPDDPNLDGDFKALIEVRKKRQNEQKPEGQSSDGEHKKIPHKTEEEDEKDVSKDEKNEEVTSGLPTLGQGLESKNLSLRLQLIDIARSDNVTALQEHLKTVEDNSLSLCHPDLRLSENQATVLHIALENNSIEVAKYLIQHGEEKLLTKEYQVTVRNTPSSKTVLHQLSEIGNIDLIKILLDRLKPGSEKEDFLRKTVLTEIKGQRPRHLSVIHIAAVKGYTALVEYLVKIGLNVNFLNNKHDTPILWAARWNHIETARALISLGANLQHQNDKGSTPLYWAVRYGFKDMVEVLIKEGRADVHQQRKLGLFSPIVLASTLGYTDIVEILLDNGADVNIKIISGFTPLHHAAEEGNLETAEVLIKYGADVNNQNDSGDSPLLVAAKAKNSDVFALLANHGSDIDDISKDGKSIWDYAIESDSKEFLEKMIHIYKSLKKQKKSKLVFASGKTPLHIAALKDDKEKLQCLLDLGADTSATDETGNNFFHLAARENCVSVLGAYIDIVDVNAQNAYGDTALHLACRYGHEKAVEILLKKAKVALKNKDGDTALHTACKSRLVEPKLIHSLMDTIVKAHNWSLVDSVDKNGNNALHLAAKTGRCDLFEELKPVSCKLQNSLGDSPQHVAVRMGQLDVVESFFDIFMKEIYIDQQNRNGDTVLHIAAKLGVSEVMTYLICAGGDLTMKNEHGNTPLHELIVKSAVDGDNMNEYLHTLDAVHENAVQWWCMKHDLLLPDDDSEIYLQLKKQTYLLLTSELYNNNGDTVLALAARHTAKEMFERILHTPNVYMFSEERDFVTFDVTKLTGDTIEQPKPRISLSSVQPYEETSEKEELISDLSISSKEMLNDPSIKDVPLQPCLGIIVRSKNLRKANEMLNVIPLKQMVSDYWSPYKWLYGLLLVLHIIYMSLLSVYGVHLVNLSIHTPNYQPSPFPAGVLLLWPLILFLNLIVKMVSGIYRRCAGIQESEPALDEVRGTENGIVYVFKAAMAILSYYLSTIAQIVFLSCVLAWYILYLQRSITMAYVLAAAFIFGWLFSIAFTPGFEAVHSYSIMLKSIILKDISRFICLYIFVLMAFSFAIQSLMYLTPSETRGEYPSTNDIIFAVFNMMIGMHDPFSEAISAGQDKFGQAAAAIKITYMFYILLTTVILLNLLIAMMTDSYANVKANEGTTWRVSSVRMALDMDNTLPLFPMVFRFLKMRRYIPIFDQSAKRWMMTIPKSHLEKNNVTVVDKTEQALTQLERDINRVHSLYTSLDAKVDEMLDNLNILLKQNNGGNDKVQVTRRKTSVFQGHRSLVNRRL